MSRGDKSLPFDQYQRYRLVADLIDRVRSKGKKLRVLDIGGRTGLLREFLPNDQVDLVDLEGSLVPGLVLGDGSRLPFAAESFDAVVSFDTLEHIPPRRRRAFVNETWRVAKSWVVIAGPYRTRLVEEAEARLRSFLTEKLEITHRYLEEHHGHGLPKRREVESQLSDLGGEVMSVGHANIERWLGLMCLSMYMDRDAPLRDIAVEFHRFYNEALYAHDHEGEVYRHAIVAAFGGAPLPDMEGFFPLRAAPAVATKPITALVKELMRFDAQRDAIAPEWDRLHVVNAALAKDIEQHAESLKEAREEVARRKDMSKALRLDARDVRAELKAVAREAGRERRESSKALRALEKEIGGNIRAREALELVVSERDAELELIHVEMERERTEGRGAIEVLEKDLDGHRENTVQMETELATALLGARDLEEALDKERTEIEEVRDVFHDEISSHREVITELNAGLESVRGVALGLEKKLTEARSEFEAVEGVLSADLEGHHATVKELEGLLQEVYKGALELEGELERERAEVGDMRAEYEVQLSEHRTSLESLEGSVSDTQAEAGRLQSELEREREEGLEARRALEADLSGHQALVEQLQQTTETTETALREQEEESARLREDVERSRENAERIKEEAEHIREDSAEAVSVLQKDLEGHQAALLAHAEELEQNVSAREVIEGDLRRVEQIASKIEEVLKGTQEALQASVREREGVEAKLGAVSEELGGERETMAFLREELESRWKNLVRALSFNKRRY